MIELTEKQVDRFWAKIKKGEPDECWLWTGGTDGDGRAKTTIQYRQLMAGRVLWWLEHGEDLPQGRAVVRMCGNNLCMNQRHLELQARGRQPKPGRRKKEVHSRPPPLGGAFPLNAKNSTPAERETAARPRLSTFSIPVLATLCGFRAVPCGRDRYKIVRP